MCGSVSTEAVASDWQINILRSSPSEDGISFFLLFNMFDRDWVPCSEQFMFVYFVAFNGRGTAQQFLTENLVTDKFYFKLDCPERQGYMVMNSVIGKVRWSMCFYDIK